MYVQHAIAYPLPNRERELFRSFNFHPLGESIATLNCMLKSAKVHTFAELDPNMIDTVEFAARQLTSNAGLFLLLENTRKNGVFEWIDRELVFGNESTNKIKMNHIQTMLCDNFIGIDKLERLKLLKSDPLIHEFSISVKELETVSRFLGNFSYKTTQMLREVDFQLFRKLLMRGKHKAITIDIDSSVVNVEGHQEGTAKGYNPKKLGNPCYNLQFAF